MNSYMGGTSLGATPDWTVTTPNGPQDPAHPVYTKENQITQPVNTFLVLDEDQASINDAMFLVDVGGAYRLTDLPSRNHCGSAYGINFADGHAELYKFMDAASRNWKPTDPYPRGGFNDWKALVNVTTHPR